MNRRIVQVLPLLAIIALAACSSNAMTQSLVPQSQSLAEQNAMPPDALIGAASGDVPFLTMQPVHRLCGFPAGPDRMECLSSVRTDFQPLLREQAQVTGDAETCPFNQGYCPIDLQEAYKLPSLSRGHGRVVAIVDAYGYHNAASDLAFYRKTMGLPACSIESKCLRIVNQEGRPSPLPGEPPANDDWKGEESLDLDMVSAICPYCKIILIQTNKNDTNTLYAGVKTAGVLHAKYIGASWGSGPEGGDNPVFHQPGVVISAAAGDNGGGGVYGGGPIQPCTYTYVVCVGGTHLVRANNTRGWSETVWNDWTYDACGGPCGATGSACSTKIAKPAWQTDDGCHMRSAADTSATASLRSPVIVYNSEEGSPRCKPPACFWAYGGTSASAQIIAAVFALGGNANFGQGASYVWKHKTGNLNDVTKGNNIDPQLGVTCASRVSYICTAKFGFDGPTGLGTPHGIGAF